MLNFFRTGLLLAALTALFMAVGYFIGGTNGMLIAFGIAVVTNIFGYWNADKLVLSMQRAREVSPQSAPDLHNMVEQLAGRAGIPTPRVYVIDSDQPNAFATGRNPQNSAVAVSRGLLHFLEPREVAAVISHELAHIRSRDTLTMTIAATLAGAISMLAQFGLFFGGGNNRDNPLGGIGGLLMVFLAPLAAVLVQMAVSRTREYEADRDGAEISGDPTALATALSKISQIAHRTINVPAERNPAMAHLYIINPLSGARMDNLFSTHPAVENRIRELQQIAAGMEVDSTGRRYERQQYRRSSGFVPRQTGTSWRVPQFGEGEGSGGNRGPWG